MKKTVLLVLIGMMSGCNTPKPVDSTVTMEPLPLGNETMMLILIKDGKEEYHVIPEPREVRGAWVHND